MLRMAWRNVWRNSRRTLITLSTLTFGVMAIVFIESFQASFYEQITRIITTGLLGNLQVHGAGYQDEPDIATVVHNPLAIEARITEALPGATTERRVLGYALAGTGDNSTAALVLGLEPEREASSPLFTIKQGHDIGPKAAREAVLGTEMAATLGARPGSEVVLLGQAADGSVANDRFTVVGIGDAGSGEMNSSAVMLSLADAQDFFALGNGVHQILVRLPTEQDDLTAPLNAVRGAVDLKTNEVLSWSQILPEMKGTIRAKEQSVHIVDFIVFLIVGLGVLNTMTMATFERTHELGVLASLGTRRSRLLGLMLSEALIQGVIGFVLGLLIAIPLLHAISGMGFAGLSGQDMLGVRMPSSVPVHVVGKSVASAAFTAISTVLVGALWPAIRAARLRPVEATRYA
jgi:ABC-type lipoprotein release transport system permease subunit